MSFLRRFLPASYRLKFQRMADDRQTRELRAFFESGDYGSVEDRLKSCANPHERDEMCQILEAWSGRPEFIERWPEASPNCVEAWIVRGGHSVDWAWEARGGDIAVNVKQDAWPLFRERLQYALSDLDRAADMQPNDPLPYARMIPCGMGLSYDYDTVFGYLERVRESCPDLWSAHTSMLLFLCEKWGGSHEQMFNFARWVGSNAARGSGIHGLICDAHCERWKYKLSFENNSVAAGQYWKEPFVRNEIVGAYYMSLGAAEYVPNVETDFLRGLFAWTLTRVAAYREAFAVFKQIGDRPHGSPWEDFYDNPKATFLQFRELARRGG